jgi:O-acetylhomoserine (thiol)-lyase
VTLPRLGITTSFVDSSDVSNLQKRQEKIRRSFFAESLGNPKLDVLDLKSISAEAKKLKVPL